MADELGSGDLLLGAMPKKFQILKKTRIGLLTIHSKVINVLINAGHHISAILAVLFSVIGAFYYLRIIKVVYFDKSDSSLAFIPIKLNLKLIIGINAFVLLIFGFLPSKTITYTFLYYRFFIFSRHLLI